MHQIHFNASIATGILRLALAGFLLSACIGRQAPIPPELAPDTFLGLSTGAEATTRPDGPPAMPPLQSAPLQGQRGWLGPTWWGNRLQDWRFEEGRIECVTPESNARGWLPMRSAHELARRVDARKGAFQVALDIDLLTLATNSSGDALGGFLIGVGGTEMDPRAAAVVHEWSGRGAGIVVALDAAGELRIRDNEVPASVDQVSARFATPSMPTSYRLQLSVEVLSPQHVLLRASATDSLGGKLIASNSREFPTERLVGNLALLSHPGSFAKQHVAARFGFRGLEISGAGAIHDASASLGPILGSQYSVSRGVLKLTAQLMPMGVRDPQQVTLEVWRAGNWMQLAAADLVLPGWTASFRVPAWDASQAVPYRICYGLAAGDGEGQQLEYSWSGTIRADPKQRDELVLAVLNCNHNNSHAIGGAAADDSFSDPSERTEPNDWVQGMWFPHAEISHAVRARQPDLLFFAGDQIYNNDSPSFADHANIELDYLYKWYLFLWAFRDLTRDTPTVTIPDDHDVFQGNIWGAGGGIAAKYDADGGYLHPARFIQLVDRTQSSHLPDAFDPTPIQQGIGVYYTQWVWGGVSFAILEDRKFKSGCAGVLPPELTPKRPDHVLDPKWDPSSADLAGLDLLGERQERFLKAWSEDWEGASMKAVLSQSPFAGLTTHHGAGLTRYVADLDANGWPQAGRRRALELIQAARAVHINGDQHLAIVAQHGLDAFGDGPWSFTGPSIANFYPRAWAPSLEGDYTPIEASEYTGNFLDGFGNRVSVLACANPGSIKRSKSPSDLYDRMSGFGVVVFHKQRAEVSFECWPRAVDPTSKDAWQYAGWPITIKPR